MGNISSRSKTWEKGLRRMWKHVYARNPHFLMDVHLHVNVQPTG
jgi:hypothetical protein